MVVETDDKRTQTLLEELARLSPGAFSRKIEANSTDPLRKAIQAMVAANTKKEAALIRLRDCDWVITPKDRMDAVRDIARNALEEE